MFALGRYGGLRCPSEVLSLRWDDIDWDNERVRVTSPKTEHNVGGESRVIPLFPELKPYLAASRLASDGECEFVISKYRKFDSSYGTLLTKQVKQAGLQPWAKPWQNLRSSRETELTEQFPLHVVCSWIGNSKVVAQKHYLQVTDEHFSKAVQNPVQQNAESSRDDSQELSDESRKTNDFPSIAEDCENLQVILVGDTGLDKQPATRGFLDSDASALPKAPPLDVATSSGASNSRRISSHGQPKQDLAIICDELQDCLLYTSDAADE